MAKRFAMQTVVSLFVTTLVAVGIAQAAPLTSQYCLAVRGNGELAPAHWGGMAQIVERLGLPKAMSGGSSASVSLFFLESIAANPAVQKATPAEQPLFASFLIKSLHGYLEVVAQSPEWKDAMAMMQYLQEKKGTSDWMSWLQKIMTATPQELEVLLGGHAQAMRSSFLFAVQTGLLNGEAIQPIMQEMQKVNAAPSPAERAVAARRASFLAGELYRAATLLGKFDADNDENLFFRTGVLNFKNLAVSFGRAGNFYAAREMSPALLTKFTSFVKSCAPQSVNQTWSEYAAKNPSCVQNFQSLVTEHQANGATKASREDDVVGSYIPTFPSTSVLIGDAYRDAKAAMAQYQQAMDPSFGKGFTPKSNDVRFGYWGSPANLRTIETNLRSNYADDAKSQRFFPLGQGTWKQVLSTSPAEPGLAPLQEMNIGTAARDTGGMVYSAGGWSDLHPGVVLKAAGCDNVVYLTRRGGESVFAQGVAKRLLGFDTTPWPQLSSSLYDLKNPKSSFSRSLKSMDAVVCTDWNRFEIQKPGVITTMIEEAYRAPWTVSNPKLPSIAGLSALAPYRRVLTPIDNQVDPKSGELQYLGCLVE